jgi:hypothetical protein
MFQVVRCGDGCFNIGHIFTVATRYKKRRYPDEFGDKPIVEEQRPIQLTVTRIQAFGKDFEEMGWGMGCGLDLEGTLDFDPKDWCFGNEDDFMKVFVAYE